MNPMAPPATGRFVWYEIVTPNPQQSIDFYTRLFGWTPKTAEMGSAGTYTSFVAGSASVGGVETLDPKLGTQPHWISYITVGDVDDAAQRAIRLGGMVAKPPTDVPQVGRYALVRDPAGAAFCPFAFSDEAPPETDGKPAHGTFCWNELLAPDPKSALAFYAEIFGWTSREMPMGEMGMYYILSRGNRDEAGVLQLPPGAGGLPQWLPYIAVDDVDAAAARTTALGGKIHRAPADIPSVGRFAVAADVTGANFAMFKGL